MDPGDDAPSKKAGDGTIGHAHCKQHDGLFGKVVDAQPNGASATNYGRRGPVPPQHAYDGQVTLFVESEL